MKNVMRIVRVIPKLFCVTDKKLYRFLTHLLSYLIIFCGDIYIQESACCVINACKVVDSGRQIKVISLILAEIYDQYLYNYSSPPPRIDDDDEKKQKYTGATVIDTVAGYYNGPTQQIVLGDFASLYPSIQIAYSICPSRLVRADKPTEVAASQEQGVKVSTYTIDEKTQQKVVLAVPSVNSNEKPPFVRILLKLLAERTHVRKLQKAETDPVKKSILNCRQLSRKVSCNSAYGLLGASQGYLALQQLAALTTYQGRMALQFSQRIVEEKYGATTVAGDTGEFHAIQFLI